MKSNEDIDASLRRTLSRYPKPVATATLTDDIVRSVAENDALRKQRARSLRHALLVANWCAVLVGAWWVMSSLPLPEWTPEALSPAAAWLIPGAVALWVWIDTHLMRSP